MFNSTEGLEAAKWDTIWNLIKQRDILIQSLTEIEASSTDQHAVGIAKAALAKVEE